MKSLRDFLWVVLTGVVIAWVAFARPSKIEGASEGVVYVAGIAALGLAIGWGHRQATALALAANLERANSGINPHADCLRMRRVIFFAVGMAMVGGGATAAILDLYARTILETHWLSRPELATACFTGTVGAIVLWHALFNDAPAASDAWYFIDNKGEQIGPVTLRQLKETFSTLSLWKDAFVWRDGFVDWKRASEVSELSERNVVSAQLPNAERPEGQAEDLTHLLKPQRTARRDNFVARHWRGEFPLWVSYWVFGFVGAIAVTLTTHGIGALVDARQYNPINLALAIDLGWLVIGTTAIWQLVGVWRSANRYRIEKVKLNKSAVWAGLVQLGVIGGVLRLLSLLGTEAIPQLTEVNQMALLGDPSIPAYHMRLMDNGAEIEITGGFKYGLADDFLRILSASPQLKVVHLNSIGGRIGEAKTLYKLIKDRGLITYTSGRCMSACIIAFVAGRERWVHPRGKLGFHSWAFPGVTAKDVSDIQQAVLTELGASPSFILQATSTSNNSMWFPTTDELSRNKIITGVATLYQFAMSGFGPTISHEQLTAEVREVPLFAALSETNLQFFDSLVSAYYDGYVAGQSEGKTIDGLRAKFLPYLQSMKPYADDQTMIEMGKLVIDQLTALRANDAKLCFEFAIGADSLGNYTSFMTSDLFNREFAVMEQVLRTATKRAKLDDAVLQPYLRTSATAPRHNSASDLKQ